MLVLPPWSRIYHWFNRNLDQDKLPWSLFFDLKSLNRYVPVIEFEQFRKGKTDLTVNSHYIDYWVSCLLVLISLEIDYRDNIDQVLYLQHYKEGWTEGGWIDKYDFRECNEKPVYEIVWHTRVLNHSFLSLNFHIISIRTTKITTIGDIFGDILMKYDLVILHVYRFKAQLALWSN